MSRIIFHIDVNSAFLSWSAVKMVREGKPDGGRKYGTLWPVKSQMHKNANGWFLASGRQEINRDRTAFRYLNQSVRWSFAYR